MKPLQKIILTGPESTGKSWLSEKLAAHFDVSWADEYARIYLEKHGPHYDFEVLGKIAKGHLRHQAKAVARAESLVFLDTDLINFFIWEKLVFGKIHPFISKKMKEEQDHLYLVAYPDLPWEPDPLRENPEDRGALFELHLEEIIKRNRPYRIVKGSGRARLESAVKATEELLSLES